MHEQDCERCEEAGQLLEQVDKELRLLGPPTPGQRLRLAVIASKCPVQKTLQDSRHIVTTLRE